MCSSFISSALVCVSISVHRAPTHEHGRCSGQKRFVILRSVSDKWPPHNSGITHLRETKDLSGSRGKYSYRVTSTIYKQWRGFIKTGAKRKSRSSNQSDSSFHYSNAVRRIKAETGLVTMGSSSTSDKSHLMIAALLVTDPYCKLLTGSVL